MGNLKNNSREQCIAAIYDMYPLCRKFIFDTFDTKKHNLTSTQRMVLLSLSRNGILSMTQLAKKINTSNEQATRAVARLVERGLVQRNQNTENRRVVNINLTDNARELIESLYAEIHEELADKFKNVSNEEVEATYNSALQLSEMLKRVLG